MWTPGERGICFNMDSGAGSAQIYMLTSNNPNNNGRIFTRAQGTASGLSDWHELLRRPFGSNLFENPHNEAVVTIDLFADSGQTHRRQIRTDHAANTLMCRDANGRSMVANPDFNMAQGGTQIMNLQTADARYMSIGTQTGRPIFRHRIELQATTNASLNGATRILRAFYDLYSHSADRVTTLTQLAERIGGFVVGTAAANARDIPVSGANFDTAGHSVITAALRLHRTSATATSAALRGAYFGLNGTVGEVNRAESTLNATSVTIVNPTTYPVVEVA
jgi:hypothetical protein